MLIKIGETTHDVNDSVGIHIQALETKVKGHAVELKTIGDKAIKKIKDEAERKALIVIATKAGHTVDDKTSIDYLRGIKDSAAAIANLSGQAPIGGGGSVLPANYESLLSDIYIGGE